MAIQKTTASQLRFAARVPPAAQVSHPRLRFSLEGKPARWYRALKVTPIDCNRQKRKGFLLSGALFEPEYYACTMKLAFQNRTVAGRNWLKRFELLSSARRDRLGAAARRGSQLRMKRRRCRNAASGCFLVRKLGVPGQKELAVGAIAIGGIRVLNQVISKLGISSSLLEGAIQREFESLNRRDLLDRSRSALKFGRSNGRFIDDGLATGATMRAAVAALR